MWVDIDVGQILGGRPEKSKKVQRRLSTKNPRMVAKYNKAWKEKLRSEGWDLELDQIQKEAEKTGWSQKLETGFNRVHGAQQEARKELERNIRKVRAGELEWSPRLQSYRDAIELWELLGKRFKRIKTASDKHRGTQTENYTSD